MSLDVSTLKLDDEIRPLVESLNKSTDELLSIARQVYVPGKVSDTVIGEVLPVKEQLQLYVVSAHVALSSLFCQRKLANEPIPDKLVAQIERVRGYLKKLKEHGIDIGGVGVSAAAPAAPAETAGSRRQREGEEINTDNTGAAVAAATTAIEQRPRKVNPVAVKNLTEAVKQQPTQK